MAFLNYFALLLLCSLSQLTAYEQQDTITLPDYRGHMFADAFDLQDKVIRNEGVQFKLSHDESIINNW